MKTKIIQRITLALALNLLLIVLPFGGAARAAQGDTQTASTACQAYLKDKNSLKQCESQTPTACKNIDRTTKAGESNFDSCLTNSVVSDNNPIVKDLQKIVDFLSAGVGIVVVAMIIVGGVQYTIAGDNASAVTAAKKRITNALIALLAFIFMFAFVQWLIPGGLFG